MGSRDKDQSTTHHHHPHISSLVVRPSVSDGGGGDAGGRGGRGGSDYEPGEVRRELPPYPRTDRFNDDPGYRVRSGSSSPARRRDTEHRYGSDFDRSGGPIRSREFGNGRDHSRHRDSSLPYARSRAGGRPFPRTVDVPGPGPFKGDAMTRNNPNVRPREGDWVCPDPQCRNLNFARREFCNNCKRQRHATGGSPRRGYPGPPPPLPHVPLRRIPGPPLDLSPVRTMSSYRSRSPPRSWARDGPRDFGPGGLPPLRHDPIRRDRLDYPDDSYRGRNGRFDRPAPIDFPPRERGRNNGFFNERKGYERPPPVAPALPPPRGRWDRNIRERSRSPIRGPPPVKDYRRDDFVDRGREERRPLVRDRIGNAF